MRIGVAVPVVCLSLALGCGGTGNGAFEARGTVEVPEVDVSPLTAARVVAVRFEEGAVVEAGDTLALLTQTDLGAALAGQRARVASAAAQLRELKAGLRPQEISRAEGELAAVEAEAVRAGKALERARALVQDNAIARQQYDDAVATDRIARERLNGARAARELAREGNRIERIQAGRAELAAARAALGQIEARAADLILIASVSGTVLGRHAEPGEVLGPGVPVLTLGETGRPYVRVFIPQRLVRGLALDTPVSVISDEGRMLQGRVQSINPKAEFTPRVALTEEERADLMFAVRVEFVHPREAPHPGLWVTVRLAPPPAPGAPADSAR